MKNENISTKMKDSGIEWIGEIPEEWEVTKIRYALKWKSIKNKSGEQVLSLYRDYGILPKDSRDDNHNVTSLDTDGYKFVEVGDFVINKMKAWQGSMALSKFNGIVSPAYYVCEFINNKVYKPYFHYLLRNESYLPEYKRLSGGLRIGQWDLPWESFQNLFFLIPPLPTQQNIATFLDKKCAAIDSAVEKELLLIEKLKSYKQSVITQAVTKGIRPNRKMKQSGIEWIGEIPQEWEVRRIKFSAKTRNEKYSELYGKLDYFGLENIESQSAKYIATDNIYDIEQAQICKKGDIAFGKLRPYLAKIFEVPKTECCSSEFVLFHNFLGINTFYKYLFLSHGFINIVDSSTYGTKMPRANADFIKNLFIPVPPFPTQQNIATFLDKKCAAIESAISKKTSLIDKLKEYKKSLIYECVTGKRECCNF